jgi:hypothetical protein
VLATRTGGAGIAGAGARVRSPWRASARAARVSPTREAGSGDAARPRPRMSPLRVSLAVLDSPPVWLVAGVAAADVASAGRPGFAPQCWPAR